MLDLTNIQTIKSILKDNRLWAKKTLGQNFLLSQKILDKIVETAELSEKDTVIEIGPGLGTLTQELAKYAKLVLAIEKDYGYVEWLRKYFKNNKNVKIIHEDILKFSIFNFQFSNNFQTNKFSNYKVVSNLPYNITSPTIRKFLEAEDFARLSQKDVHSIGASLPYLRNAPSNGVSDPLFASKLAPTLSPYNPICLQPSSMVFTVQKEVAERICAQPGNSERGLLTVMVEFYADAEIIDMVSRDNFWPVSKVDSAIIKITSKHLNIKTIDPKSFFRIVKIGFSQKRRKIVNPLAAGLHLSKDEIIDILKEAKIDPNLRAEDLSLENWKKLSQTINSSLEIEN